MTLATIRQVAGEAVGGKPGLLEQCLVTPINLLTLYQLEVCLVRAGPVLLLLEGDSCRIGTVRDAGTTFF